MFTEIWLELVEEIMAVIGVVEKWMERKHVIMVIRSQSCGDVLHITPLFTRREVILINMAWGVTIGDSELWVQQTFDNGSVHCM